jgi:exopolysaccharide biosynthesis polyprenyl glycosylphosphotransferase
MIHRRVRGVALLHCGSQIVLGLLLFWSLAVVQFGLLSTEGITSLASYSVYSLVMVGGFVLHLLRSSYRNETLLHLDAYRCGQLTLQQLLHISAPLFLYLVAAKDGLISRVFLFTYLGLLVVLLYGTNRKLPALLARLCFRGRRQQRTLICGLPEDVGRIRGWLERKTALGMQVLGFMDLRSDIADARVGWEPLANLETLVARERINQVILTRILPASELHLLTGRCEDAGCRLFVLHDLEQQVGRPLKFIRDDGFHFISLREEPLECPLNRLIKRCLDVAIAIPIVTIVLPLASLLVWLMQSIQSPGPLFFRQRRTGLHNEEFWIVKFRTMHSHHGRESEQAGESDERVFPFGSWLRKLSADELPQFVNVLRGEMSIVGPRPHLFEHDAVFAQVAQFYRVRALIKPGITGLAQVRGFRGETKNEEQVRARVASDLFYLENWSPTLDCLIIARTAWQVIRPPQNAY